MPINYKVIGEGFPMVLLHGWTLDHQVMLHAMEPLFKKRSGWRRIYIDLPGMGQSEPSPSIQNSDDMLEVACTRISAAQKIFPSQREHRKSMVRSEKSF